jgi:hypothetical protein
MIRFACACGERYKVPDEHAGQKGKCKVCGRSMTIPVFVPATAAPVILQPMRWPLSRCLPFVAVALFAVTATLLVNSYLGHSAVPSHPVRAADPAKKEPGAELDWGQKIALEFTLKYEDDPSSLEIVEWWPTIKADPAGTYIDFDSVVYSVMRSKNQNGALTVGPRLFYLKGQQVVHIATHGPTEAIWQATVNGYYGRKVLVNDPLGQQLHNMANGPVQGKRGMHKP